MKLMIIESPGKKKKLQEILSSLFPGQQWRIEASLGHIRDLPAKGQVDGQIVTGVRTDFNPVYELSDRGKTIVSKLKAASKEADEIFLATDGDREGESISWHLEQCLSLKNSPKTHRISFNEITESRVKEALQNRGKINIPMVAAQEARRVLDRLVGYMVSPELKRQSGESLSAGRVQSPAVRLVVERERAIRQFKPTTHYGVRMIFADAKTGEWFADWQTIPDYATKEAPYFLDKSFAERVSACRNFAVRSFEEGEATRNPPAPFTTSTLQQAASNAFGLDPKKTMQIAQALYEQGHISYHRTDNPNVSEDSMPEIRAVADALRLQVVSKRRVFKSKEGAQEGHPAITPTHWDAESAGESEEEQAIYKLVRIRAIASQLMPARYAVRTVSLLSLDKVGDKDIVFEAKGRTLIYAGWLSLLSSDATQSDDEKSEEPENPIPDFQQGAAVKSEKGVTQTKVTRAPPRYTKATLVKTLEAHGIGRPATYAQIMDNIETRNYIREEKRYLHPTPTGEKVSDSLVGKFEFIDLNFTKELEDDLDKIASGQSSYKSVIEKLHSQLAKDIGSQQHVTASVAAVEVCPCPSCQKPMRRIKGQKGAFWGCTGYPDCKTTLPDSGGKPETSKKSPTSDKRDHVSTFTCLKCGKPLIHKVKKGKGGFDFFGCSGYSVGCKTTYGNLAGKPDYKQAK